MRVYNRTNIPEKTAVEAVSLILNKKIEWENQRVTIDKIKDNLYYVDIFGFPTIKVEIEDDDATIVLVEETD